MKTGNNFSKIREISKGDIFGKIIPIAELGYSEIKTGEDVYNIINNPQSVFTDTIEKSLRKLIDVDRVRYPNFSRIFFLKIVYLNLLKVNQVEINILNTGSVNMLIEFSIGLSRIKLIVKISILKVKELKSSSHQLLMISLLD